MKIHLLIAACAAIACAACNNTTGKASAGPATDQADSTLKVDSIGCKTEDKWLDTQLGTNTSFTVDVSADYPVAGPQPLVDSIRALIATDLNLSADSAAIYGTRMMDIAAHKAMTEAHTENFGEMGGEWTYSCKLGFSTPGLVTFNISSYQYTGGAHGLGITYAVTFNAETGQRLGWNIFTADGLAALKPLVREAVSRQYFEADSWKDAASYTWGEKFELPAMPPAFTDNGLTFYYTPYEIAPYAAGKPTCTLPYSDVKPLLTPAIAELIGTTSGTPGNDTSKN